MHYWNEINTYKIIYIEFKVRFEVTINRRRSFLLFESAPFFQCRRIHATVLSPAYSAEIRSPWVSRKWVRGHSGQPPITGDHWGVPLCSLLCQRALLIYTNDGHSITTCYNCLSSTHRNTNIDNTLHSKNYTSSYLAKRQNIDISLTAKNTVILWLFKILLSKNVFWILNSLRITFYISQS